MRQKRLLFWLMIGLLAGAMGVQSHGKQEVYGDFNYGKDQGGDHWVQAVFVSEPPYRSEVRGDTLVKFRAVGMDSASAFCWRQPENWKEPSWLDGIKAWFSSKQKSTSEKLDKAWGYDHNLTPDGISLDAEGNGSFTFKADRFPHGPVSIRIFARNKEGQQDICELQLFNLGGVRWNQGIPKQDPPAIEGKGLKLVFADDFDGPLSISSDGRGARYSSRKPRMGDFSGWQFSDILGDGKPFAQQGTWLRIAARKDKESPKGRSGLIASVNMDGKGIWAKAPAYLECRFIAQSAMGTWPAFWTLTHLNRDSKAAGDEIDIIEAYGAMGKGNPNHPGYSLVFHPWNQKKPDGTNKKHYGTRVNMMELGGKSYWSTTFHTYAVFIGKEDTVYYCDDIEVFRHPTNDVSWNYPHCFFVNLAIGGISRWPIDLSRYNEGTDMWVDYVRVYAAEEVPDYVFPRMPIPESEKLPTGASAVGVNFASGADPTSTLRPGDETGYTGVIQGNWNNLSGDAGTSRTLADHSGRNIPSLAISWETSGTEAGEGHTWYWGFELNKRVLLRNALKPGGKLSLSGIPYPKYDVYVYLGAHDLGGSGKVSISSASGGVDPAGTYYHKTSYSQSGGRFVASKATSPESTEAASCVVFTGNTAKDVELQWSDTSTKEEGWTGIAAIQIVAVP